MRLIDADEYKGKVICNHTYSGVKKLINIDDVPTAYNPDNVVEELEALVKEYDERIERRKGECYFDENEKIKVLQARATGVERAIEIVKQGGVTDDVCEWMQDDMCEDVYRVCGGCFSVAYHPDFKYCPYCGKKIKVV